MKILSGNSKNEEERLNEHEYERINEFNTVGRRILWTNKEEETEDVKSKKKKKWFYVVVPPIFKTEPQSWEIKRNNKTN